MKYPKSFELLVDSLKKLPGVGTKSAERMAYEILEMDVEDIKQFIDSLTNIKKNLTSCEVCGLISETKKCDVCQDNTRDQSIVCVVQSSKDAFALERAKEFNGLYHVLNGVISVTNGTGPNDINITALLKRIELGKISEVIIATNPNVEGETTALYISKLLEKKNVSITRLAYGLPVGGNLDYADDYTLLKALQGRRKI
jgi:recombination protein RecR